jgi:Response regulator containing CheY-like receiver, AAA-type ATPase, and DNA-binding domains
MHLPQDVRIKVAKASLGRGREVAQPEPDAPVAAVTIAAAPATVPGIPTPSAETSPPQNRVETSRDVCPELAQAMLGSLKECKDAVEHSYLEHLLRRTGGDVQRAMELSGLSRSHLYALLKKWGLSAEGPGVGSGESVNS